MECTNGPPSMASAMSSLGLPAEKEKQEVFLSWISILIFILMLLFFRSVASPFLNPTGEPRKAVSSSFYFNLVASLYVWLVSATALTILPHFTSGEGNTVASAALFFPMVFATIGSLLAGRFCIRMAYYASRTTHMVKDEAAGHMIAFQRPFRKLIKASMLISGAICFLYAHCWSSKISAFKIDRKDGAGAVCRAVFSPLAFGGLSKSHVIGGFVDHQRGADDLCIWLVWAACIVASLIGYAQDEFAGKHCKSNEKGIQEEDTEHNHDILDYKPFSIPFIGSSPYGPENTLPMVPWYSVMLIYSAFDLLVAFKVFLGRFDARTLQPALQTSCESCRREGNVDEEEERAEVTAEEKMERLKRTYGSGSVFDMSKRGEWFDFVADTGDGFDSSYQVSRMLAQPSLDVISNGQEKRLPRGEFMVIGGDLAYPDPTEETYEQRLFRTYEDAMQPPPSFRRRAVSTKPNRRVPANGWSNCFKSDANQGEQTGGNPKHSLDDYQGPSVFALPGNHDWFDGLETYTRFILGRDWLGGWYMPQERSYFAIKLRRGWWIFGADLGLSADLDLEQFKFFANIASTMEEDDAVIIMTHEPHWVLDPEYNHEELAEKNLRELMRTHLKGKVRLRCAGDLHHYTRHSPIFRLPSEPKSNKLGRDQQDNINDISNDPQLIVSGGGGAFLHGTHTYHKYISVGDSKQKYKRVACFPDEKTSLALGWVNILHFRFRNWRLDIIWAIASFGISSSLFPVCGIYQDYMDQAHDQGLFSLIMWVARTTWSLFCEIFVGGRLSLFFTVVVTLSLYTLTDTKVSPRARLTIGLLHAGAHIIGSLLCLILIQCLAEWLVADDVVVIETSPSMAALDHIHGSGTTDLASCLYDEYNEHWSTVFANFTGNATVNATSPLLSGLVGGNLNEMNALERAYSYAFEVGKDTIVWIYDMSLLSSTLYVFDLPGLIATKHHTMCQKLCADGMECLVSSDPVTFALINRMTRVTYLGAIFLYFGIMAVSLSGGIFGTWLALMLNVFKAQCNEGFSSLRVKHWKNFLKIRIDDDGELEVYAIGLARVPQRWRKDPKWRGDIFSDDGTCPPSWSVKNPSKWISLKDSSKFTPEVVDHVRISKRSVVSGANGIAKDTAAATPTSKSMPTLRRTASFS